MGPQINCSHLKDMVTLPKRHAFSLCIKRDCYAITFAVICRLGHKYVFTFTFIYFNRKEEESL